ncbi:MAG: cation-translocating P-type ATPase [Ruminococcaceae bacterium]|nr:cation-translocating P-type ATPase [Oscillospiraceae bacterium]
MKFFSKNNIDNDFFVEEPLNSGQKFPTPSHKLTADEVLHLNDKPEPRYDGKSALESLKKRMLEAGKNASDSIKNKIDDQNITQSATETEKSKPIAETVETNHEKPQKSLLEKCKPFITDTDGNDASIPSVPLYKLESVAEILQNNSLKTLDRLAEKYDITFDNLGKTDIKSNSPAKDLVEDQETQPLPTIDKEVIEINAMFNNVQSSVPFAVSEVETDLEETENYATDSQTITFIPVNNQSDKKATIVVSSNTQNIDLTGEIAPIEEANSVKEDQITLEKSEFEEYIAEDEIETKEDTKRYIRKFSIVKRNAFLVVSASVILTLVLAFMKLPFMSGLVLGATKSTMIFCAVVTGLIALLNIDMFSSVPKIFSKKATADVAPSLATLCVFGYAVSGIIANEIILDILLLLGIILSIRALGKFRKASYMLSNLRQIASSAPKKAVKLIDDTAVTFAMAKNSIEGDTMIAAPQECEHINDFIKYSTFGTFINGKMPIITILSVILSIISGFAAANYFDGLVYGFYAAAGVLCFASLPTIFFIRDFPLYAAAKKLNKKGSMISGNIGALHIEMANAIMLDSADIFPDGTVTLHQMKVLSENNLDKTLLRAASLTECLKSPLAPIFKKIAGESNISTLPNSDTIKYEERMGLSGWVDDQLLFIGNRTLMQAHGIDVPDIEIDRKILRSGYFPVYVASDDKVCALLVVQYSVDPEVSYELRRLTKIGVTLLVNNTDPNITDQMICDYLGLYDDSVMIMTNAGYHMYKNAATPKQNCSAPASFRFGNIMIAKIMNCANKIKRSNALLTTLYIISAVLGIVIFAYSSFAGSGTLIDSTSVLLYSLICTVASYLLYLIEKP